jgi:hypothetical protein
VRALLLACLVTAACGDDPAAPDLGVDLAVEVDLAMNAPADLSMCFEALCSNDCASAAADTNSRVNFELSRGAPATWSEVLAGQACGWFYYDCLTGELCVEEPTLVGHLMWCYDASTGALSRVHGHEGTHGGIVNDICWCGPPGEYSKPLCACKYRGTTPCLVDGGGTD